MVEIVVMTEPADKEVEGAEAANPVLVPLL
jgi:hypothetical protein